MGVITDTVETKQRFEQYASRFVELCRRHGVGSIANVVLLVKKYRCDPAFQREWSEIWRDIRDKEGAKLTLTTVATIIGLVLGGVGIAAGGSAIGLPLALILGPVGYFAGQESDSTGFTSRIRRWMPWSGNDELTPESHSFDNAAEIGRTWEMLADMDVKISGIVERLEKESEARQHIDVLGRTAQEIAAKQQELQSTIDRFVSREGQRAKDLEIAQAGITELESKMQTVILRLDQADTLSRTLNHRAAESEVSHERLARQATIWKRVSIVAALLGLAALVVSLLSLRH